MIQLELDLYMLMFGISLPGHMTCSDVCACINKALLDIPPQPVPKLVNIFFLQVTPTTVTHLRFLGFRITPYCKMAAPNERRHIVIVGMNRI